MQNIKPLFATFLITLCFGNQPSIAAKYLPAPADCAGLAEIPFNQIYKYDSVGIKRLFRSQDCVLPDRWAQETGANNKRLVSGGSVEGISYASRTSADKTSAGYVINNKIPCSYKNGVTPGGFSINGMTGMCEPGPPGFPFAMPRVMFPNIPLIGIKEDECLNNMINQIYNGITPTVDINLSGGCATGTLQTANMAPCGAPNSVASGSICATEGEAGETASADGGQIDKPFARTTTPRYIPVSDIAEMRYINNSLNQMTAIYLPNGGTVKFKNESFELDAGMFITMNANGEVFFGPDWQGNCNDLDFGTSCKIRLDLSPPNNSPQAESYVNIIPKDGVVNVDEVIFQGDTLNKQTVYVAYEPTGTFDDKGIAIVNQITQNGPGPTNNIQTPVAKLLDLPETQTSGGAIPAGLTEGSTGTPEVLTLENGQPSAIEDCNNPPKLFCVKKGISDVIDTSVPPAAQHP